MNKSNDIQETRTVLDGIIADLIAETQYAGLTVQELGDLIEATDIKGLSTDNLFITKQSFLHSMSKLGWRSKFLVLTQKDKVVLEELVCLHKKGLTTDAAFELVLKKRDFNGTILTEADIRKSLESICELAQQSQKLREIEQRVTIYES